MTNDPGSGQPSMGSESQGSVKVAQMQMGHLRNSWWAGRLWGR